MALAKKLLTLRRNNTYLHKMKRLLKAITLTALLLGGLNHSQAVPAYPGVLTMTQPDGTQIRVRLYGDERGHYYTTESGVMLLEGTDGAFRYAELDADGEFVGGELYTGDNNKRMSNTPQQAAMMQKMQQIIKKAAPMHPYVDKSANAINRPRMESDDNGMSYPSSRLPGLFPGSDFPTIGSPKVLVLLVQYTDVKFSSQEAPNTLRAQITQRNYKERGFTGSVVDFYYDASKGQFTPQFDVIGPITLPNTQAYYGANTSSAGGSDARPREMVIHACNNIIGQVNFSDYDNNHDGFIDNVYVIYAGRGEASGGGTNTIWPHSWSIPVDMSPTYDGVKLSSYACGNELTSSGLDAIGTFCHEFGHVLGLPDLYSTGYNATNHPGIWALMASGSYQNNSKTPPTLSAWERSALGWLKPTILEKSGDYTLPATLLTTNTAFVIPTAKSNEYFTLENRQQDMGDWDNYLPSWGMLVWHIDYNPQVWNYNVVNDDASHQYANIVEAHGHDNQPGYSTAVCFPSLRYYSFDENTPAKLKAWDGSLTDITLTSISEDETYDETSPTFGYVFFTAHSRCGFNSVSGVEADNEVRFVTDGMTLRVEGAPATRLVTLYAPDGRMVLQAPAGAAVTVPARGLYIAVCGDATAKLLF